jgi:hypothetical protein
MTPGARVENEGDEALGGLNSIFTKNVGLGVTDYYETSTVSRNVAQRVKLNSRYNGPMVYLALSF